jgi:23S rRNA pseudouridine1911/1915/1917 synthase
MAKERKKRAAGPGPRTDAGAAGAAARERRFEALVEADDGPRADRYIAETLGLLSRSQIKARGARVEVDGREIKLSRPLKTGERLIVTWVEEPSPSLVPESIPLSIVYEDERVIVVDKARGMVTHPGAGNRRGTLANAVLGHLASRAAAEEGGAGEGKGAERGGIVHRLDKDTSGIIIVAKDAEAQAFLASQFKDRTTKKEYLAVVSGLPRGVSGRVENRLGRDRRDRKRFAEVEGGGRIAVTDWRVVATYGDYALMHLRPRTGRTHQLRVHLAGLGTPIVGDPIYGKKGARLASLGLMLHAWKLSIRLPDSEEPRLFTAPPPRTFTSLLAALEARYGKKKPRP